jgi:hypothetical protein
MIRFDGQVNTGADNTFIITDYNNDNSIANNIDALNAKTTYDGQGRQISSKDRKNRTTNKLDPTGIATTVTDAPGRARPNPRPRRGRAQTHGTRTVLFIYKRRQSNLSALLERRVQNRTLISRSTPTVHVPSHQAGLTDETRTF